MPSLAPPEFERAAALLRAGDAGGAEVLFRKALAKAPGHAPSLNGLAHALGRRGEKERALEAAREAHAADPASPVFAATLGVALGELGRWEEAQAVLGEAVKRHPASGELRYRQAEALRQLGRPQDAAEEFDAALALDPRLGAMHLGRAFQLLRACDWTRYEVIASAMKRSVQEDRAEFDPFTFFVVADDPAAQLRHARRFVQRFASPQAPLWTGEAYRHRRLRIGYLSTFLYPNPVGYLMAGVLEAHDRERFEVFGFSYGRRENHPLGRRLSAAFEHFSDAGARDDAAIAAMIRKAEIDVLVDLKALTNDGRARILARRPAPLQVSYLGFSGTAGAPYYDYILGDRHVIPPGQEAAYAEAVVRLPETYFPTDDRMAIGAPPDRAAAGLPETGLVFCAFNQTYKFTPALFDVWMRLLKASEGSVLWLLDCGALARSNLAREARARGVSPDRLVFAGQVPDHADHLARLGLADLYLDSLPYGGHTSAADALWAGAPVVTCTGPTFVGRVATSQLSALGMPELIAPDLSAYETLALALAGDPARLAGARAKLAERRERAPLFDSARMARHLEAAFAAMHQNRLAGGSPGAFDVPPLD